MIIVASIRNISSYHVNLFVNKAYYYQIIKNSSLFQKKKKKSGNIYININKTKKSCAFFAYF